MAQALIQRHFVERIHAGIYVAYEEGLLDTMLQLSVNIAETVEDIKAYARTIAMAEFPLIISADQDADTQVMTDFHLRKINTHTGCEVDGSFVSIGELDDAGELSRVFDYFTQEQATLLLRQAHEQTAVNLDPRDVYSDLYYGWDDSK